MMSDFKHLLDGAAVQLLSDPLVATPAVVTVSLPAAKLAQPLRLYAAGRISPQDWRQQFFRQPELLFQGDAEADLPEQWPILPKAFVEAFDYTGPYFVPGAAFGSGQHGAAAGGFGYSANSAFSVRIPASSEEDRMVCGGYIQPDLPLESDLFAEMLLLERHRDPDRSKRVVRLCLQAIVNCDIMFAWVDSPGCYGTLAELGYAKALGKRIWIAGPMEFPDLWFTYSFGSLLTFEQEKPVPAFSQLLERHQQRVMRH